MNNNEFIKFLGTAGARFVVAKQLRSDVNTLIDAMTSGGLKKRGILFALSECINGENAVVLRYLRDFMKDIIILEADQEYGLDDLRLSTSVRHQHPVETYGINLYPYGRKISFMVDTRYFPDLIQSYKDAHLLVVNAVRYNPHESGEVMHLCVDDVREILSKIKPKKAILTHFGMTMLKARPWELAKKLTDELGLDVIMASDGMTIGL